MRSRLSLLPLRAVLAATALLATAPNAGAVEMHTFGRAFCEGSSLHDYGAVLDRLPPVRHVPRSGQLPFGPRNLTLYATSFSPIIVGRGGYGYAFFDETYRSRTLRLNWDVTIRLLAIGANGGVLRTVGSAEGFLGVVSDIAERSFRLDTPTRPALYRFEIEFRDHTSGAVLGAYSEYLRVVKPTFHARIAVERRNLRPGQSAYARIENRGTAAISFGVSYEIQRFDGGHWTRAPGGPSGAWPAVEISMGGGGSGWCMRYRVPPDAPSGRYRFVKGLGSFDGDRGGTYTAQFHVGAS